MSKFMVFALAAFLLGAVGCTDPSAAAIEANKQLVRDFTDATNAADWDRLRQVVVEDFVRHSDATAGTAVTSLEQFIALQDEFLLSFPDQRVVIDQIVAEGDRVAMMAIYSGTQTGPLAGFPPSGRQVRSRFLALFRIESGQVAELWVEWDNLNMLSQLGLFPPTEQ